MTRIRLPFVNEYRDRHNKMRRYVRRPGCKKVPLKGEPGSEEFMAAYHAALAGKPPPAEIGASRTAPGTVNAAIAAYLGSRAFQDLAPTTCKTRRSVLERFRKDHGDKRIATLRREDVERMVEARSDGATTARRFLDALRPLLAFCVKEKMRTDNPSLGIEPPKMKIVGYRTWTEDDIAAFESKYPVGSRARLALALFLYTGQRRSDVVRMGRQHVRNGVLTITQQKTGTTVVIPVHPELARIIEATKNEHLTFLVSDNGKPLSPHTLGNWMREICDDAGLPPGTSAHGLRKAACVRLAELGLSAKVIASISGHKTLREVERYVEAADRTRLARMGMAALEAAFPANVAKTSSD